MDRIIALHFRDLGARRGWVVSTTFRPLYPGKDPVPIVQEAGWVPGPVWTCAKNLATTGIFFKLNTLLTFNSLHGNNVQRKKVVCLIAFRFVDFSTLSGFF